MEGHAPVLRQTEKLVSLKLRLIRLLVIGETQAMRNARLQRQQQQQQPGSQQQPQGQQEQVGQQGQQSPMEQQEQQLLESQLQGQE
ncbi:hypothetical protein DUNSADRAFT_9108 [Dunaliella salina]|uniref:Encoded protein n=1 Tax=Dunaliella salina TaxID=3046 RepID=A0ABQ7H5L4_DUNSA|nr:hypothetical protein DUNSADRAFT_9108 [Dunaliella salina]|eukprot:KAF5842149.1 hypothetical protein DUNSADRAFT_9108 [Dunaliella salina]